MSLSGDVGRLARLEEALKLAWAAQARAGPTRVERFADSG